MDPCLDCEDGWITYELRLSRTGQPIFGYTPEDLVRTDRTETRKRECLCRVPPEAFKQVPAPDGSSTVAAVRYCLACGRGSHPDSARCRNCGQEVPQALPDPPKRKPTYYEREEAERIAALNRFAAGDRVRHTCPLKGERTGVVSGHTGQRVVVAWDSGPVPSGRVVPDRLTKIEGGS